MSVIQPRPTSAARIWARRWPQSPRVAYRLLDRVHDHTANQLSSIREDFVDPRFQNTQAKSRIQQPAYYFTMNCLLCSRVDVGLLTDRDHYDEDVDAYLEHLLASLADPKALSRSRKYLSKYDTEVIKRLSKSREARLRYTIYRTDSDFLLLSAGTFAAAPMRRGRGRQEPIEEGYVGRGKTYYHFAYSYSQRLHVHNTAMGDVLEKLVLGFDRYTRMLSQMRDEQGDLLEHLRRGERIILERAVSEDREEEILLETQDQLLEAISEYQRTRSGNSRSRVEELVRLLEQLKPGFVYDLERLDEAISTPGLDGLDLEQQTPTSGEMGQGGDDSGPLDLPRYDAA